MAPTTLVGLDATSSLCSSRHPSNVLTGIFTRLMREHFSDPDNIEFAKGNEPTLQLDGLIWNPNETLCTIQIKPVWEYSAQALAQRPGIYTKRNKTTFERIAINNGWTTGMPRDAAGNVKESPGEYHALTVVGSHTFFCVGRTGAETELLAQEVSNHLAQFGPSLRAELKLQRLQLTEVGEVGLLDEFVEHYCVPVVLGYALSYTWRLLSVQPFLKKIGLSLNA